MPNLSRHLPSLDGVRGLAILLVLCDHLLGFNNATGNRFVDSLAALRSLGWMGVDLFFVLSGFLITGILYETVHSAHFFRNFYMRRFLRIFPLYYGFLLVMMLICPALHVTLGWRPLILLAYQQNASVWFPQLNFNISPLLNFSHFWSLAVEEQFYFFWPLIVFAVKDRRKLIGFSLILSFCALALRISLHFLPLKNYVGAVHEWTLCRMDTLMIGGCLALLLRGDNRWITKRLGISAFAISMAVMACIALADPRRDVNQVAPAPPLGWNSFFFVNTFGYTMLALGFSGLIVASLDSNSVCHRIFKMRWLRHFGKYSYGIYVLHFSVGYLFDKLMRAILGQDLRFFLYLHLRSHGVADLIAFLLNVGVIYGVAWISFNLYEVRFLRLKRKFAYSRLPTEPDLALPWEGQNVRLPTTSQE